MVFDGPGDLIADEGTDDLGGHLVVVLRGEAIADVVQQGANNPVDIGTVVERPGGRLQAVLEAVDLVAREGLVGLTRQFLEHALPGLVEEGLLELVQREVVVARAVLHLGEGHLKVFGDPVAHGLLLSGFG